MGNLRLRILFAAGLLSLATPSWAIDTFRFPLADDPATLDWTQATTNYETYVLMNIMEGLVELDSSLQPQPALASRWEISSDGLTYTFFLKPGIKWSDGIALKAADFITSWKRLLAPKNRNEYRSFLSDVDHMKALSDDKLEVRLRKVVPYFLSLLSFWVTFPQREDLIAKYKSRWSDPKHLVTLGAYRIAEWARRKQIVFERNPTYYRTPPSIAHVVATIEPNTQATRRLLEQNKIDALLEVNTDDIGRYTSDPSKGWRMKQYDYLALDYLATNLHAVPMSNTNLRHAIALALDRSGIGSALQGGQYPADSFIPKGLAGYDPATALSLNISRAKHALHAAGYDRPDQVPTLRILARKGVQEAAANYVRDTIHRNLGITMVVKAVSPAEFKKALQRADYQYYVGHWGADYPDASSFMEMMLSTSGNNFTHWNNPQYDSLVKEAATTLTMLDRLHDYTEAQHLLLSEDTVVIPLFYPKLTALIGSNIQDFEISPLNYLFFNRLRMR